LPLLLLLPPPGVPVKMVSRPAEVEDAAVVIEGVEVVLYRLGSVAPQGLFWAQSEAQVLSDPQLVRHWTTNSWQMKNVSVNVYSETLGCLLSPQRQPKVKVPGSQSLTNVGLEVVCWQMIGQVDSSELHQDCLVANGTLSGSI